MTQQEYAERFQELVDATTVEELEAVEIPDGDFTDTYIRTLAETRLRKIEALKEGRGEEDDE